MTHSPNAALLTCPAPVRGTQPYTPKIAATDITSGNMHQIGTTKLGSLAASAALCLMVTPCSPALANETIAEFATSGLIPVPGVFRDTVKVVSFTDKDVAGVTLYYTDYSRSLQERLSSEPFADPSQASLTCVATGPVVVQDPESAQTKDGVEVFSELKTLNLFQNKRLKIRRIYDGKAVLYVAYSTRFTSTADEGGVSSSRYRTSICAVPVSAPALQ